MTRTPTKTRKTTTNRRTTDGTPPRRRGKPTTLTADASAAATALEVAPPPSGPTDVEVTLPLSVPEPAFAARMPPPEPEPVLPSRRRAIFFDVENTSRAEHIARVIEHLAVDRIDRRPEFFAVGNWKVVGHDTARLLAQRGAHLVHSAPSVGVRDWSDLRIAVSAGVWLAGARPGDVVEIVSDDRAFDAVGDVAASLGIEFRRLSYRALAGAPPEPAVPAEPARPERGRRRRRGRRRGGRGTTTAPAPVIPGPRPEAAPVHGETVVSPHTAPHDEIVGVARDLMHASPTGGVTIDTLANALKARGFRRTSGSPRLITRLRRIKELAVSRSGMITLSGETESDNGAEPTRAAVHQTAERISDDGREESGDDIGNRLTLHPSPPNPLGGPPRRRRSRRGSRRGRGSVEPPPT